MSEVSEKEYPASTSKWALRKIPRIVVILVLMFPLVFILSFLYKTPFNMLIVLGVDLIVVIIFGLDALLSGVLRPQPKFTVSEGSLIFNPNSKSEYSIPLDNIDDITIKDGFEAKLMHVTMLVIKHHDNQNKELLSFIPGLNTEKAQELKNKLLAR